GADWPVKAHQRGERPEPRRKRADQPAPLAVGDDVGACGHGRGCGLSRAMPATPAWPPRSLPRLFVKAPLGEGALVELDSSQANYLGNVLRMKAGGELLLFDG